MTGPFVHPTPGKLNSTDGPGFAGEVHFSPGSGTFRGPFNVELHCASSNAVIHYTTDGTLPNAQSPVYRRSLPVTKNLRLRARAYEENLFPGPPHSDIVPAPPHEPGFVCFESPRHGHRNHWAFSRGVHTDAIAELTVFEPREGRTSLTNPPAASLRASYHIRGSSTMDLPKSSFVLHLLNEFNQEQHRALLGLPPESDWVLYAPNRFEPVLIHNPFIHQLSRDIGRYSPRTRFVEVYAVRRAGPLSRREYQGIYVLEEKIKIGRHRVEIDRLAPSDVTEPEVTGGYLLKIDRLGSSESGFWTRDASIVYVEPKERVISLPERAPQREYLNNYFKAFEGALHGANWKDPVAGYRAYIDVDAWVDYHVLEVLSGNVDALVYSTYFYKPRKGKLVFGPHWDFDRALGSTDGRDDNPRRWNTGHFFGGPWYAQLFRDPDFWQAWVDRWQNLREKQFSIPYLFGLIDHLADQVREAEPREAARWDVMPRGGTYQSEVDWMKEWLSNRVDFIDEQLVAKPGLNLTSGPGEKIATVAFNVPEGTTVYYTLNGSDPRLAQGGISSNALVFTNAFKLDTDAQLVARARNPAKRQTAGPRTSTPWSGPVRADVRLSQPER